MDLLRYVPINGCSYCSSTAGIMSCPYHGPNASAMGGTGGVGVMEAVLHQHHWVYDGMTLSGLLIYHCDQHDPPEARYVSARLG